MNALPYYKRFPRDFLEGTSDLPLEQKGAYSILIDLLFLRGGALADTEAGRAFIAGHLGCSVRKWNQIKAALILAGKLTSQNGYIQNARVIEILDEQEKYLDIKSKNGGGSKDKPEIISRLSQDNNREKTQNYNKNNKVKNRALTQITDTEYKKIKIKNSNKFCEAHDPKWSAFKASICKFVAEPVFNSWLSFRNIKEIDFDNKLLSVRSNFVHGRLSGGEDIAVALRRAGWALEKMEG